MLLLRPAGADSRFIRRLNAGDDTPGGGSFSQIATDDDEIIIPFRNCFLKGTERTRNVILQNYYQKKYGTKPTVTHQNIYEDPVAVRFMLDALDNPGTVDPNRALRDFPKAPPPPLPPRRCPRAGPSDHRPAPPLEAAPGPRLRSAAGQISIREQDRKDEGSSEPLWKVVLKDEPPEGGGADGRG